MRIGKLFLTSWTLIFLCISPWAYKQEGLIHEYKYAVFVMWAYTQGAYTQGEGAYTWVNTVLSILFLQVFAVIQFNRKNLLGWTNFLENQRLRRFYPVRHSVIAVDVVTITYATITYFYLLHITIYRTYPCIGSWAYIRTQ